jgi:O-antigen/teichoic acid export membrane protein
MVGSMSWITDYLLPSHYIDVKYLVVCAIAPTLLYALSEITSVGIGISRRTGLTVWSTLSGLIVNIIISYLLIPSKGAAGAVIANAISYMVFFVIRTEMSSRVWTPLPRKKIYLTVSTFLILVIGVVLFGHTYSLDFSALWILIFPVTLLVFRHEIRSYKLFK